MSIARPRLWGYGALALGLFLFMQLFITGPRSDSLLFYGGMPFGLLGLYLVVVAQRPSRRS
ncbi:MULTISPECIES: hypothetical protein [unclassified Streptomyces]|uniref:hypothetical protein n=1 Tax=unclassified Streptomyces TaxID=2593676 RepID=UPI003D89E6E8